LRKVFSFFRDERRFDAREHVSHDVKLGARVARRERDRDEEVLAQRRRAEDEHAPSARIGRAGVMTS
jgi:hypothetical protein